MDGIQSLSHRQIFSVPRLHLLCNGEMIRESMIIEGNKPEAFLALPCSLKI